MAGNDGDRTAEVLRLGLIEGVSVRQIARRLQMSRKTIRKILGRRSAPPKPAIAPRGSLLDPYMPTIRKLIDDSPEMLAPAVPLLGWTVNASLEAAAGLMVNPTEVAPASGADAAASV